MSRTIQPVASKAMSSFQSIFISNTISLEERRKTYISEVLNYLKYYMFILRNILICIIFIQKVFKITQFIIIYLL